MTLLRKSVSLLPSLLITIKAVNCYSVAALISGSKTHNNFKCNGCHRLLKKYNMTSCQGDKNIECIEIESYDEFAEKITELENKNKNIFIFFSSSRDENGKNWCPDCATAEPIVNENLSKMAPHSTYVRVSVGSVPEWKDQANKFRTDLRTKLTGIPTLVQWKKEPRLEVEDCKDAEKVADVLKKPVTE